MRDVRSRGRESRKGRSAVGEFGVAGPAGWRGWGGEGLHGQGCEVECEVDGARGNWESTVFLLSELATAGGNDLKLAFMGDLVKLKLLSIGDVGSQIGRAHV